MLNPIDIQWATTKKLRNERVKAHSANLNNHNIQDASGKYAFSVEIEKQIREGKMKCTRGNGDKADECGFFDCYNKANGEPVWVDINQQFKSASKATTKEKRIQQS